MWDFVIDFKAFRLKITIFINNSIHWKFNCVKKIYNLGNNSVLSFYYEYILNNHEIIKIVENTF